MTITGAILRNAVIYAAQLITSHRQEIDALNVFPVPDGDTGTNMSMTITNASREVRVKDDSGASRLLQAVWLQVCCAAQEATPALSSRSYSAELPRGSRVLTRLTVQR